MRSIYTYIYIYIQIVCESYISTSKDAVNKFRDYRGTLSGGVLGLDVVDLPV